MSKKKYKLSEIADFLGGKIYGDSSKDIHSISSLNEAKEGSISFLYNKKFIVIVSLVAPYKNLREKFKSLVPVCEIYLHMQQGRLQFDEE